MTTTDSPAPAASFAVRVTGGDDSPHLDVTVFAGPDPDHRANCGRLVMRRAEAQAFAALLGEARR